MKKLDNPNINSRTYWNLVYGDRDKRDRYAAQGTSINLAAGEYVRPTMRFLKACDEIQDGQRVLDIGCGVGVFTRLVKTIHPKCEVWGTDISDKAMHDNWKERPDIQYIPNYIGELKNIPTDYFDVVFSGETLEHLDKPEDLFKDAHKSLKTGGKFVLTTPEGDRIKSEEHVWEFTHEDVEKLYLDNGFHRVRFIYLPDLEHLLVIMAVGIKA
jgi:2-polyprenyl-3-methyl-5-hydroxy-6-metoxy-1,4-benzoquinol methylase